MILKISRVIIFAMCLLAVSPAVPTRAAEAERIAAGVLIGVLTGYGAAKAEQLFESEYGRTEGPTWMILWWLESGGRQKICGAANRSGFIVEPLRNFFTELGQACGENRMFQIGNVIRPLADLFDIGTSAWLASWTSYLITRRRHQNARRREREAHRAAEVRATPAYLGNSAALPATS